MFFFYLTEKIRGNSACYQHGNTKKYRSGDTQSCRTQHFCFNAGKTIAGKMATDEPITMPSIKWYIPE